MTDEHGKPGPATMGIDLAYGKDSPIYWLHCRSCGDTVLVRVARDGRGQEVIWYNSNRPKTVPD